jgi:hypothetical protein
MRKPKNQLAVVISVTLTVVQSFTIEFAVYSLLSGAITSDKEFETARLKLWFYCFGQTVVFLLIRIAKCYFKVGSALIKEQSFGHEESSHYRDPAV